MIQAEASGDSVKRGLARTEYTWSSNAHDPCLLENRQKNAVEVSSHSVSVYHLRYHSLIGITMFQVFRPPKFPSPSAVAANK